MSPLGLGSVLLLALAAGAAGELPSASPEQVGLDPAPLRALRAAVAAGRFPRTTSVLVVKDGRLVHEEYFEGGGPQHRNDTRSAMKSVTSLAVGIALAEGRLASVDESAFGRLADPMPFAHDGPAKRGITLEDFLTMSSALACNDWDDDSPGNEEGMYPKREWVRWAVDLPTAPGYARDAGGRGPFRYCTAGTLLLGQIVQRAAAMSVDAYVESRLLAPLGIEAFEWPRSPSGEMMTGGGLRLRSRDLAKLALLVLEGGRWAGRQVVPEGWIRRALTVHRRVDVRQEYGYLFWRRDYATPAGPVSGWFMLGNGGNVVVMLPRHRLAAIVTRVHYNTRGMHQQTLALLEEHVFAALARPAEATPGAAPASPLP